MKIEQCVGGGDDIITLFPRRKAGQSRPGGGRGPVVLNLELLEQFYGMPLHVAAKRLVSTSSNVSLLFVYVYCGASQKYVVVRSFGIYTCMVIYTLSCPIYLVRRTSPASWGRASAVTRSAEAGSDQVRSKSSMCAPACEWKKGQSWVLAP